MVKRKFNFNHWLIWGGIPAALVSVTTVLVTCSKTIAAYAELPQEVTRTKDDVVDIKKYIEKQQMSNDLMQKIVAHEQGPKISDDGKFFFNAEDKRWEPIKLLKSYMEKQ